MAAGSPVVMMDVLPLGCNRKQNGQEAHSNDVFPPARQQLPKDSTTFQNSALAGEPSVQTQKPVGIYFTLKP